ncbi:hypothetical protein [Anaerovibrio sp. RM50]|uniref:hypothetical protein n=1 Tax=Anaerovibrio sp. RM50 TaxID=1200557 RepID=UPI00068581E9|nr:hypothetical protein [Anaerovibrio sp. RM50]
MNEIKKDSTDKQPIQGDLLQNRELNQNAAPTENRQYNNTYYNSGFVNNLENTSEKQSRDISYNNSFTKRIKQGAWVFLAIILVGLFYTSNISTSAKVDNSPAAQEALESHISTTLAPGTRLLSKDGNYVGGDVVINHSSEQQETNLLVWDYAAEDGDYVQIIANGTPLGEPFMIKNKPVSFTVPTTGDIQVVGTHDGGGGITYAVHYGMNNTTYFNGVNQGENNTYTLIRE